MLDDTLDDCSKTFFVFLSLIISPSIPKLQAIQSIPLKDAVKSNIQIIYGIKISPAIRSISPNAIAHPVAVSNDAAQTKSY